MTVRAVTFDVAGTLVDARWNPCRVVELAAAMIGIPIRDGAGDAYGSLYHRGLPEFHAANQVSDSAVREFWIDLDRKWLEQIGAPRERAEELYEAGWSLLFSSDSEVFLPFGDAESALLRLRSAGFALAAVSNWDNSLPVVFDLLGWTGLFDVVVPSLVFGHEKPDPRIFHHALGLLGVGPGEAIHIGDDPIDDLQGARSAGVRCALIDRTRSSSSRPFLHSLDLVETAFQWTD